MHAKAAGVSGRALVSVGIPTFNRPDGLRRTLECITKQSYANLEIIVSDNCSTTTDTERVVREIMQRDPRLRYFRQTENIGPTKNIRFVLEQATGEYFMWAADDDEWDPAHIESLIAVLMAHDHVSVAHCQTDYKLLGTGTPLPFFVQGAPLGDLAPRKWPQRARVAAEENFGELFYGLYRRGALLAGGTRIDFEYGEVIHAALKAMLVGDVYVSRSVSFYKYVTEEAFLWTYLCARDKCVKAANPAIDRMLEHRRRTIRRGQAEDLQTNPGAKLRTAIHVLWRKARAVRALLHGCIAWHRLYYSSAAATIGNVSLPSWKRALVKTLIAWYLVRSMVWTFSMKLKWKL